MKQGCETEIITHNFAKENIISHGTRSICYRESDMVYKVMPGFVQQNTAIEVAEALINSRDILVGWLGEYVTPSKIGVSGGTSNFKVVIEQPYIYGMSLRETVEVAERNNLNIDFIIDFLERSLNMYKDTNQIPDIFGRPHVFGWYQVLSTPNVRVELKNGVLFPKLLDIGFARLSQNVITESHHNRLLANNIEMTIEKIKNKAV